MPIYEVTNSGLNRLEETKFAIAGLQERRDLQRLLRHSIEIVSPDTLVISEEFGDWDDSRRRIDLLGIDKNANIVVVELKRTEDGGHMELQAIRYAAMVSRMTFHRAAKVYQTYLDRLVEGLEGLVHVSEMSAEKRVGHPREVVKVGETVRVQVLAVDREKRQIKLSMKSLAPTSIDEFLAEHKQGDVVTGRVVEASGGEARVELGEGIEARCRMSAVAEREKGPAAKADLSSLTSMLNAKWKGGGAKTDAKDEALAAGQIRSFRIVKMDPEGKRVEVEVA
jgi:exosome complex RNA-binding protein Csl4